MLTDTKVRTAKPKETRYRILDDDGLYLDVHTTGRKTFLFRYRMGGKDCRMSLGVYPEVTLKDAREKAAEFRRLLAQGVNPMKHRDADKLANLAVTENTLENVCRDWFNDKLPEWKENTARETMSRLEADVFPVLGTVPIDAVTHQQIIDCLKVTESRSPSTAKKLKMYLSGVYRFAIQRQIVKHNLMADLVGILQKRSENHFNAITDSEFPEFLKSFDALVADGRVGQVTRIAFDLMMLNPVRTSELITAEWKDFDFDNGVWTIPWKKMKMGSRKINPVQVNHVTPLAHQSVTLLKKLRELTGYRQYLFPNVRDPKKPMSNGAILMILKRMGYRGRMTGHGFRTLFVTTMEKLGYERGNRFSREALDKILAHKETDKIQGAYFRGDFFQERRDILQFWADYIDRIRGS